MTTCRDILPELCAYADGELKPEARARVAGHVAACPMCKDELRLLEATGRLLLAYGRETRSVASPRPGLSGRVRARIATEPMSGTAPTSGERGGARVLRAPAPSWRRALPWAVAAAVLLGAGVAWRGLDGVPAGGDAVTGGATARAPGPSTTGASTTRIAFDPLEPRAPLAPPTGRRAPSTPSAEPADSSSPEGAAVAHGAPAGGASAADLDGIPEELLAKLDLLESWDLVESMELLDALDDPEDPTQGLVDEENG